MNYICYHNYKWTILNNNKSQNATVSIHYIVRSTQDRRFTVDNNKSGKDNKLEEKIFLKSITNTLLTLREQSRTLNRMIDTSLQNNQQRMQELASLLDEIDSSDDDDSTTQNPSTK